MKLKGNVSQQKDAKFSDPQLEKNLWKTSTRSLPGLTRIAALFTTCRMGLHKSTGEKLKKPSGYD
jgi:hypothetical protein